MTRISMGETRPWIAPWLVVGVGVFLIGVTSYNLLLEFRELDLVWPPLAAAFVSVSLAGGLVYAGWQLRRSDLRPEALWRVASWSLGGSAFLVLVSLVTLAIRLAEGRIVGEALLDVLVSSSAGGLAGYLVGLNTVRADDEAADARQARDALAFLNQLLRHELLNGLNLIHGYASQLAASTSDGDEDRLDAIVTRSEDLATLVRTIRPAARTFSAEGSLSPVDLSKTLTDRIEAVRRIYPDAAVSGEILPNVHVRANGALSHVFQQLLVNAVEHNDRGTASIDVSVEIAGETVRVAVADDGPGIDDCRKVEIFETKPSTERGFGLYLVRTLVVRYGGEVWVENNGPRGSVFVVELQRVLTNPAGE